MSARRTVLAVGLTAAALLVACGSGAKNSASSRPTDTAVELQLHGVSGIGTVLTDPSGRPLYTDNQEARGTVKCTGACLSVFMPLSGTSATVPNGTTATIGTIKRADMAQPQLTYNGAPLYTYVNDGSWGDASGNGVHDAFGGTRFTWHAVVITR
jgi:predicted lipoprotein with Yx(FWY)xxD motif